MATTATDTKNFKVSEFACKHCGENEIDQRVINMAQTIREELGVPVHVNSGYRCPVHNASPTVKGAKNSKHMKGLAADLSCKLGAKKMWAAIQKLYAEGKLPDLDYCIRYKTFCHIDCGGKRKGLWEIRV
ncbi:MAG: DUF882 domain-containing protein [Synergistaceae bacterium]|nr:DUF882 domain-containing protein [Synergistaceae bacterium]MBR0252724.1 DUF882 domain-containing protein [Synergistaceae bacterium]